eukprot:Em0012g601a
MKYFFAVALMAWLGLGTALPYAVNSVEESLIAEADGTALEEDGYWIPEDNVIEEGAVTITGCIPEATTFFDKYLSSIVAEVPKRIKSIQLTCGKCSSLVIDGEFKGSVNMCKSGKGDPCIKTITKATCDDPNSNNDLVFPLRLPIDGVTTLGTVKLVITSAQQECLTIQTDHAAC